MDGFETTVAIRESEKSTRKHMPIIALTAHAMKGDKERCLAAGMDGYLSKPIRGSDLFELIERSLGCGFRKLFLGNQKLTSNRSMEKHCLLASRAVPSFARN